ncbi:MAG: 1-acyl-sn-glycerol-3-phosphate acyltransferase [Flavobacteriaceae bacterium]|jgi:1-acyl-sn-glycerol-3-phosphate acyltransferase|nr:1-acyl-sn-glycerol-3-phosphate acyltransferase [Flavobacteriaceae bacterium]MBT5091905.1 1-acyl-sn-glycerol-3-phosphate acyltransferase [Flavobacteriaceae bacterium]MBT5282521.1 1-acyl-sn-glycerol-3-phosphate acyltransferase [Flavobacteriaceae bacterium]MBT5446289.1 1-acyl-sn-glycerol-3-phosphate acyltransferase [Flavobacteriaceae bacterium]MBT5694885.1 1-acyl-sn-glycerol-3-phosphate acyltransferase [Flavobacteriaceae bacterium]
MSLYINVKDVLKKYLWLVKKVLLVLWRGWFYFLAAIPVIVLFIPLAFFVLLPNGYRYVFWIARNVWAPFVLLGMGFWVKKANAFPEEGKSFMLIANHTSYIDVMVILRLRKTPFVFVGKKELVNIPIFGFLYKRAAIMVDRSSSKSRFGVYGRAQKVIAKGYSVCIFPETDYIDESIVLNPFKQGAFKLAIEHELPILPMAFLDCKRKFPWHTSHGFPGDLRAKALEIIPTSNLKETDIPNLQEKAYQIIKISLLNDPKGHTEKAILKWKKQESN